MTTSKRLLKVFLCHASQDKPIVRELYELLNAEGWMDLWLDEKKLLPGQDWRISIEEAVETSDIVIICLSSNSVNKEGFIQKELRYAREIALEKLEESIFLIPLRFNECDVPRGLRFYQHADYFGEKKNETYDRLLKSLRLRYEQKLMIEKEGHKNKIAEFEIKVFQIARAGSQSDECEDALAFVPQEHLFAIADGTTDSAFQRLWADLLVKGFINHPPDFSKPSKLKIWFEEWLKTQQDLWDKNIQWDTLSWAGLNKAKMTGGLATFLGVYFFPDKPIWKGIAFGDCNLFQFRTFQLIRNLWDWRPLTYSEEFGSNPVTLSSINTKSELMFNRMAQIMGDYAKGDTFFLATDALSAWLLREIESNGTSWNQLLELKTQQEFETFINELRSNKKINNDDSSLITIEVLTAPEFPTME